MNEENVYRVDFDDSGNDRAVVVAPNIELAVDMAREACGKPDSQSPKYVRMVMEGVLVERDRPVTK